LQNKILNSKTTQKYQNPIVLIGGGISGQYSAFILQRLGFENITILEKSNTVEGGRCNVVQLNGNNYFPGAMRIPKDDLIDKLLEYLEIPTKPFHNDTPTSVVLTVDD
jgi:monoamine oxidase